MIIYGLISVIFSVIMLIFGAITVPGLPEEAYDYIWQFIETLENASSFFSLVFPVNVLPFVTICLAIHAAHHVYAFAMWVLKKVPLLGID